MIVGVVKFFQTYLRMHSCQRLDEKTHEPDSDKFPFSEGIRPECSVCVPGNIAHTYAYHNHDRMIHRIYVADEQEGEKFEAQTLYSGDESKMNRLRKYYIEADASIPDDDENILFVDRKTGWVMDVSMRYMDEIGVSADTYYRGICDCDVGMLVMQYEALCAVYKMEEKSNVSN